MLQDRDLFNGINDRAALFGDRCSGTTFEEDSASIFNYVLGEDSIVLELFINLVCRYRQ